jgi:hypothetical protein
MCVIIEIKIQWECNEMLLITAGLRVPLLNYCEQTESLHIHGGYRTRTPGWSDRLKRNLALERVG